MGYREIMRRKLLEEMYNKMSDEEKKTFIYLTMQDKDHKEIMEALASQHEQISRVAQKVEKQNWTTDFLSDVGANVLTDSLWAFGRRLFRKI